MDKETAIEYIEQLYGVPGQTQTGSNIWLSVLFDQQLELFPDSVLVEVAERMKLKHNEETKLLK